MNAHYTTSLPTRFAAFAVALVTIAVVLGSTVAGMQPRADDASQVVALERITITATRTTERRARCARRARSRGPARVQGTDQKTRLTPGFFFVAASLSNKCCRGGSGLSAVTLARFFSAHIWWLPAILAAVIGIHLYMVIRLGISAVPTEED